MRTWEVSKYQNTYVQVLPLKILLVLLYAAKKGGRKEGRIGDYYESNVRKKYDLL